MIPAEATPGVFVTGTGTGVGKTWVGRGLARALCRRGRGVVALKPVETGCDPDPLDARALAWACGRPAAAEAEGFYRVRPPVAPRAATLMGEPPPPTPTELAASCVRAAAGSGIALVEGAGGLLVPLGDDTDFSDFARALGLPLIVVTTDGLGVLSHTRAVLLAARSLELDVGAVVLTRPDDDGDDPSRQHNAEILAAQGVPIHVFERCRDDDDALADEAERAGLVDRVLALAAR